MLGEEKDTVTEIPTLQTICRRVLERNVQGKSVVSHLHVTYV